MAIRVKTIKAKNVKVGDVITAYWEAGRHISVLNGEVTYAQRLRQGGVDIDTKGTDVREYFDDENVEVKA